MSRLTADKIHGVWAGITMTWDETFRFDEEPYARNIERLIAAGVHGIYTTGSTGEFYALEYGEFCRMVDMQAELCGGAGMPLQIGCCSDATAKTIKLLEYAAGRKEVGAAQVTLPYWMELTERELLQFFKDLHRACPEIPLVHYNVARAKRFLQGPDYVRILEAAPNLIGVKYTAAGDNFGHLQKALMMTPELSYFVAENLLVSAMQLGAKGSYSSLVCSDPRFMLEMYAQAQAGRWPEAIKMQQRADRFFRDIGILMEDRGEGGIDPVCDKGLGVASGCLLGHQRCRPPYIGWSDEFIETARAWLREKYPEFLYPGDAASS